jgi:hypothetical protein
VGGPEHLLPARREHVPGGERRDAQVAVQVVALARLKRRPERQGAVDGVGDGQPTTTRQPDPGRVPFSPAPAREVGQDRSQHGRLRAAAGEQLVETPGFEDAPHRPPAARSIRA